MSYRLTTDWRNKNNLHLGQSHQNYNPMYNSIASYCNKTKTEKMDSKSDLNEILHNSNYLTHLHMLPNPLQKNLADAFHEKSPKTPSKATTEEKFASTPTMPSKPIRMPSEAYNTTFGTIGSFITGVFSVISSAMPFQRRTKSPERDLNSEYATDGSPPLDFWLPASAEMQNKNNRRDQLNVQLCPNATHECDDGEMSSDCRTAAVNCEDKLEKVRMLLVSKPVVKPQALVKPRRPKRVFVQPKSVEEGFEDAFTEEDFVRLSNEEVVECVSLCNHVTDSRVEVEGAKMRTDVAPVGSTELVMPMTVPVKELAKNVMSDVSVDEVSAKNEPIPCTDVKQPTDLSSATNVPITMKDVPNIVSKDQSTHNVSTKSAKSEMVPKASSDTKTAPIKNKEPKTKESDATQVIEDSKTVIIQSCEDKVSRLKALLQERRKNNTKIYQTSADSVEETVEEHSDNNRFKKNQPIMINRTQNKHYKNPNRLSNVERRAKSNMRKDIKDDMSFANEIDIESSSVDNSPKNLALNKPKHVKEAIKSVADTEKAEVPVKIITESPQTDKSCYFNEISGRFRNSSTTESEDSFQIVFTDSPQLSPRVRRPSDCDSEDSFIIFEDVSNSCYTTADVFGHSASETDYSDYDTDDSDHNMSRKLSHNLSRTVSDLTDDSLYEENAVQQARPYSDSEDEVDSSVKTALPVEVCDVVVKENEVVKAKGLLLDATKKLARKEQPKKTVHFSTAPPKVRVMRVWAFAARQARAGHWEQHAVDRERFKRKIADVDVAVSWVLKPQHRNRIKFQRFMPWWHAERRREIAEKKEQAAAEEKRRLEEEARRLEEEKRRLEEERIAEEERQRVEHERKEKERLKAEEKRLKELNRKRLQEQHMKSEAQRALEVSQRRAENERRRKEEEKYRIEAKRIAGELKKKAEEDKKRIEEEIAQLEAEKAGGHVSAEVRDELLEVKEVIIEKDEVKSEQETVEVKIEEAKEDLKDSVGAEKESAIEEEHHRTGEESTNLKANTDEKACVATELSGEKEIVAVTEDLNDVKDVSSYKEQVEVINQTVDDTNKVSNNAEIKMGEGDINQNVIAEDYKDKDNSGCAKDSHAIRESNSADIDENFVDCIDNLIIPDKKRSVAGSDNNNIEETQTHGNVTENCSEISEIEVPAECSRNNNTSEQKSEQNVTKSATESSKQEDTQPGNTTTAKIPQNTNQNVKNNNQNTVKPAMKKIQFIQNSFSSTNVVKSNVNKLNAQNTDKNMNSINHAKRISPIVVNEKSNVTKQN